MQTDSTDLPSRKHLPHQPPPSVSQYTRGAPYFITICADRNHYGIPTPPLVGRVVPNAPHLSDDSSPLVGRVVPNAPHTPTTHIGGLRTNRPTSECPTISSPTNAHLSATTQTPLTIGNNAVQLLFALDHYRATNELFPRIAVVMPDHIHFIATFPESSDMTNIIRNWKRWTARQTGIVWQDGFFDHRLRSETEVAEKMNYIAQNPVRKNLCFSADDWPFRFLWP